MFTQTRTRPISYRRLARDQRNLAWLTLLLIALHVLFVFVDAVALANISPTALLLGGFWILVYVACAALVGAIASQMGMHAWVTIFVGILAFVPFVCLLPIVAVLARLNQFWKQQGLVPTIFGVDPVLAEGLQHGTRCAGCGYNLHGNESGVCSECGREIEVRPA